MGVAPFLPLGTARALHSQPSAPAGQAQLCTLRPQHLTQQHLLKGPRWGAQPPVHTGHWLYWVALPRPHPPTGLLRDRSSPRATPPRPRWALAWTPAGSTATQSREQRSIGLAGGMRELGVSVRQAGRLPPPAAPSGRRGFPTKPEGSVFCVGKINGMMQTAVFMYKQMCVHQKAGASGKVPRPPTTTGTEAEVLDPPGPATQVCATWSTSAVPGLRVLRTLRALGVTSRPLRLHSAARRKRESVIPGGDATP